MNKFYLNNSSISKDHLNRIRSWIQYNNKKLIAKIALNESKKNNIKIFNKKLPKIKSISSKNYPIFNINNKDFAIKKISKSQKMKYDKNYNNNNNKNNTIDGGKNNIKIYNSRNYFIFRRKNIHDNNLKKSSSTNFMNNTKNIFFNYKSCNPYKFHQDIMNSNKFTCHKKLRERFLQIKDENDKNNSYINSLFGEKKDEISKAGIFDSKDKNISIIEANFDKKKYDSLYEGVNANIKNIIENEILDAQFRLKVKPKNLVLLNDKIKPLYKKKIEKYKYLSSMNIFRELNQDLTIPSLAKDRKILKKIWEDAVNKIKKNLEQKENNNNI